MRGLTQNNDAVRVKGIAIPDDSLDGALGDSFIEYPCDEATAEKARAPLIKNGANHLDSISRMVFFELAWFFDSSRNDPIPEYSPDAIEKMRKPVLGYGHYRVGPKTLRLLSDLAWS
jgi:hypothetical protein